MSSLRAALGAVAGAAAAGVALRVRRVSDERGASFVHTALDLPTILVQDAANVTDAAKAAVRDGRAATVQARIDFDEQVAARSRRTGGHDD